MNFKVTAGPESETTNAPCRQLICIYPVVCILCCAWLLSSSSRARGPSESWDRRRRWWLLIRFRSSHATHAHTFWCVFVLWTFVCMCVRHLNWLRTVGQPSTREREREGEQRTTHVWKGEKYTSRYAIFRRAALLCWTVEITLCIILALFSFAMSVCCLISSLGYCRRAEDLWLDHIWTIYDTREEKQNWLRKIVFFTIPWRKHDAWWFRLQPSLRNGLMVKLPGGWFKGLHGDRVSEQLFSLCPGVGHLNWGIEHNWDKRSFRSFLSILRLFVRL